MFWLIILPILFAALALLLIGSVRSWVWEEIKEITDVVVVFFLRFTSQFGSELTKDGLAEQELWREQRLRNLRGLALRSHEKRAQKPEA